MFIVVLVFTLLAMFELTLSSILNIDLKFIDDVFVILTFLYFIFICIKRRKIGFKHPSIFLSPIILFTARNININFCQLSISTNIANMLF